MRPAEIVREVRRASFFAVVVMSSTSAFAQAWTPGAGSGSVWLIAQTLHADAHTEGEGRLVHNIDLRAHSLTAAFDYGLTDRMALSVSLPYTSSRYRGPVPHAGSLVDDGNYHGAVSDLDVEIRYKVVDRAVVFTPSVGAQWPTRNYPTLGHASPGRGLTEYSAGFDFGHEVRWLTPALFIGGGYSYSQVEPIDDHITVNRSNTDLRIAYYASSRLSFQMSSMWQHTHGGLDIPLTAEQRREHAHHHDQMLRADHWRASAALAYSASPTLDLVVAWSTSVKSENSHAFRTLSLGTGWSFNGPKMWRTRPPLEE